MLELDKELKSIQYARNLVREAKKAQSIYATFPQEKIDSIVCHVAHEALKYAEELAKLANEETGFGNWQDKVLKNVFAAKTVYEYIKDMKTVGIINEDPVNKVIDVGVPLGVIVALVPSTNPTSTAIYKAMIALKAGNAIVFSPHPNAQRCTKRAIDIVRKAAEEAGAPAGLIGNLELMTLEGTKELMHSKEVSLILATGGEGMVRAAYNSGTPTISGGPGNGPAFIERSADIRQAVSDIVASKTFDNGVICASEQSIIVERCIYDEVRQELLNSGAYFMNDMESDRLANLLVRPNGAINPETVGKSAKHLSDRAGFSVPDNTQVLISIQDSVSRKNPYAREKLCPVLGLYIEENWQNACQRVLELLTNEGQGHTLVIHTKNEEVVREFALQKPVHRILVNTPSALGGIGATTNLTPALTLGCGAVGGGSTSDNVGPLNLINIRKVGYGVRSVADLKQGASEALRGQPATGASCQSYGTSGSDYATSIVDDIRFQNGSSQSNSTCYSTVAAQPAAMAAAGDDRFGSVSVTTSASGDSRFITTGQLPPTRQDVITEENVELIIKEVLGRLKQ
ncbi:MAG: acetaldehyde dehydrogenase (acetylating) [Enterobacteriaceae bacterium]